MNFWRVLRVVASRRWIILAFVVLAAGLVFLAATFQSQKKLYEAEAYLEPQNLSVDDVVSSTGPDGQPRASTANSAAADRTSRISDMVMLLRSNNDLYLKTAGLLRQPEDKRAKEVGAILNRNGYFAAYETNLETQASQLVTAKQLLPAEKQGWVARERERIRTQVLNSLATASDSEGSYAPTGMKETEPEIAAQVAEFMSFDTVTGPMNTETNPQIVNQIRVSGRFEREAQAKLFVNLLCVAFIDYYTVQSTSGVNGRIEILNEKKKQAVGVLDEARKALARYRLQKGVLVTAQQEQLTAQLVKAQDTYDQTVQELQDAQGQVTSLETALAGAQKTNNVVLPSDQNPQVGRLQERIADLQIQLAQLRGRGLGDEYPDVALVLSQLSEAQRQLVQVRSRPYVSIQASDAPATMRTVLTQAKARRQGLQQRLNALGSQVARLQQQVTALPQVVNKLAELDSNIRIADRNVQDIDSSLSRYKLLVLNNGRAGTVSIISQAHTHPLGGDLAAKRGPLTLVAALLAAILCTAGVVLFDAVDPSIRTAQDAEKLYGIPVEGMIPEQTPDPELSAWVTYRSPDSPVSEAYRLLRTRLMFIAAEHPFQSLLIMSGRPGQGSTTTASNLAITLAQDGKKVILVDANLRDPQLHTLFHCPNDSGLTTLLTVDVPVEEVLRPTSVTNLELLAAGPMPLNPSELLGSPRMRYIHHELKTRADFIVYDTPSVVAFADAAILSSYIDASLLVVRANTVPRDSEKQVRSLLEKARANIIGLVFNAVPADQMDAVSYHAHYYAASRHGESALTKTGGNMPGVESTEDSGKSKDVRALPALSDGSTDTVVTSPDDTAPVPIRGADAFAGYSNGTNGHHPTRESKPEEKERENGGGATAVATPPAPIHISASAPNVHLSREGALAPVADDTFSAADPQSDASASAAQYTETAPAAVNDPALDTYAEAATIARPRFGANRLNLFFVLLLVTMGVFAIVVTIGNQGNVR